MRRVRPIGLSDVMRRRGSRDRKIVNVMRGVLGPTTAELVRQAQHNQDPISIDDALRSWMSRQATFDVKYVTALGCITELENENAALRMQLSRSEHD